jgi:hypothetical protein
VKLISITAVLFFIFINAFAGPGPGGSGTEHGNGGAGICEQDYCQTLHSANILTFTQVMNVSNIPNLLMAIEQVSGMYLSDTTKNMLLKVLIPSPNHQYTQTTSKIDAKRLKQLKDQYAKALGEDNPNLDFFAITGYDSTRMVWTTLLLPEFFKLKPTEQAAVLMHEMMWVVWPFLTYTEVLTAEGHFQDYMEKRGDDRDEAMFNIAMDLSNSLKLVDAPLYAALYIEKDRIQSTDLSVLLGTDFLKCINSGENDDENLLRPYDECKIELLEYLAGNEFKGYFEQALITYVEERNWFVAFYSQASFNENTKYYFKLPRSPVGILNPVAIIDQGGQRFGDLVVH